MLCNLSPVPPAVIMGSTTNTVSVKERENVNLTCRATGYPTPNVTWVRVNAGLLPNGELRHAVSGHGMSICALVSFEELACDVTHVFSFCKLIVRVDRENCCTSTTQTLRIEASTAVWPTTTCVLRPCTTPHFSSSSAPSPDPCRPRMARRKIECLTSPLSVQ